MNANIFITVIYLLAVIISSVKATDQEEEGNYGIQPVNISLIVLGRSGSGISSTVRQLLGPNKTVRRPNSTYHSQIEVYEVPLISGGFFKIADVDGLRDGKSTDEDVQVLSSLKSYLQDPLEEVHKIFFLVISKFDDSRFYGEKSIFVKMFRSIQILHEEVYRNATINTALVLTRLMSETVSVQRRPQNKMNEFRSAIQNFTSFPAHSIEIVVGENLPEGYNLVVENGQTILPNKQLYPQNVFDALLKIARSLNNTAAAGALTEFMDSRNHQKELLLHRYPQSKSTYSNTSNGLFTKIHLSDSGINRTEISTTLSTTFESFNDSTKTKEITSFINFQQFLQSKGITTLNDLPNNPLETSEFFKTIPKNTFQRSLLSAAFNLTEFENSQPAKSILNDADNTLIQSAGPEIKLGTALENEYVEFFTSTSAKANSSFIKLKQLSKSNNLTTFNDLVNYINLDPEETFTFLKDDLELLREFFEYQNLTGLNADNSSLVGTQMETTLSTAFNTFSQTKSNSSLSKLQEYFQSMNLTTVNDLPKTTVEKVKFFQTFKKDRFQINLLSKVFQPPEFVEHPVVGYGFDVTMDESLRTTPFMVNKLKPNSIGYLLPSFISCNSQEPIQVNIALYDETKAQSINSRLQMFRFKSNETVRYFEGKINPGFNFKPYAEYESLQTLTTVKEIRTIKCELDLDLESIELNEEFQNRISELVLYDSSDRYSVNEWKAFFNRYGTHVVSSGYGGGRIDGLLSRQNIFENETQIKKTLDRIVNFGNFTPPNLPIYRFFGSINDIPVDEKHNVTRWQNGLKFDPIMLDYELSLIPISKFVNLVNTTLGVEVEKCMELLLSENLVYKRAKRVKSTSTTAESHIVPTGALPSVKDDPCNETSASDKNNLTTESHSGGNCIQPKNNYTTSEILTTANPIAELSPENKKSLDRPKAADYTENTVGQGFNLLTGVVLKTSPFELGELEEKEISQMDRYNFTNLGTTAKACFKLATMKMKQTVDAVILSAPSINTDLPVPFNSKNEYIMDRIHKWSGNFSDIVEVPKGFVDEIPTWINIQNKSQTKRSEFSLAQLHLKEKTNLSKEFLNHTKNLYFKSVRPWSCSVKKAWKEFFNTYGTHYIKSAHAGQFETSKCKVAYCCKQGITILKSTFVLEKIGLLLYENKNVKIDLDEAYYQLLKNNLECSQNNIDK